MELNSLEEKNIKNILRDFGLTETESDVYLFLSKHGACKGTQIAQLLSKDKAQVYHALKRLLAKGIVESTLESPIRFTPVEFEKIVESTIKAKKDEAERIENTKLELLNYWKSIKKAKPELHSEKFMVIEGRHKVYDKIKQIINKTESQLSIISNATNLLRSYQFGIYDSISKNKSTNSIEYRILTGMPELRQRRINSVINAICKKGFTFRGRPVAMGLELSPQMVLRDKEEILLFINPKIDDPLIAQDDICFWTNCKTIVQSYLDIFENQWQTSNEIQIAKVSKKSGKSQQSIDNRLEDEKIFNQKYLERLRSAEDKIEIITTPSGLVDLNKNFSALLRQQSKNGVSVKILAPIVKENISVADEFSDFCKIRHIPINYCKTTIIDGKHVFQRSTVPKDETNANPVSYLERIFYTENIEYLGNLNKAFAEIWKNSQQPSSIKLESILGDFPQSIFPLPKSDMRYGSKIIDMEPPGSVTEKDILRKQMNPERIFCSNPAKDISRMYASLATVLVHPPKSFNLPSLIIQPTHVDKQSSFGAEDYIVILLQLEKSPDYIPVAFIGENPNAQEVIKQVYAGNPAAKNMILVNKEQIQIRLHGNTMFAGWTIPIPLYPTSYVLPPACLLIEGYGNVKTGVWTTHMRSGFKVKVETNYLNSYVTFIHPSSKYSGTGTDGILCREYISTNYPPQRDSQ